MPATLYTEAPTEAEPCTKHRLFPSYRLVVLFLLFSGSFLVGINQFSLPVTITCMVNATYLGLNASTGYEGRFNWNREVQSNVLASEQWGAIGLVFLVGWLLDRFGAKWLYSGAMLFLTLIGCLMPVSAELGGWGGFFATRFFQGTGMEVAWPAVFYVISQWFPADEYGMGSAVALCGFQVAALFAMLVSGYFCSSALHWQGLFCCIAILTFLGAILWVLFFADDPEKSRFTSRNEASYIKQNRPVRQTASRKSTPWLKLLTSPAIWAIVVCNFSGFYLFYFVPGYIPTYLKEKLGLSAVTVGIYAALPVIFQLAAQLLAGPLSDQLAKRINRTILLKVFTFVSAIIPAILISCLTIFTPDNSQKTIIGTLFCLFASNFFNGFSIAGHMNAICFTAPRFTGTVAGLCSTAMYLSGIVCYYVTGAIVGKGTEIRDWHTAFYVSSAVMVAGAVFFIIFGSGEEQEWATDDDNDHQKLENSEILDKTAI